MSKQVEVETTVIATRVTKPMYKALLKMLSLDAHITVADYIRDLIRRDLEQKGLLKLPEQNNKKDEQHGYEQTR